MYKMKKLLLLSLFMMSHILVYASSFGVSPNSNTPSTKSTERKTMAHKTSKSSKGKAFTLFKGKQKRHKLNKMQAPEGKVLGQDLDNMTTEGLLILGLSLGIALIAIAVGFILSILWLIIAGFSLLLIWLIIAFLVFIVWDLDGLKINWSGH